MENLSKKIQKREAKIAVIGLGYVGLPVACMFASRGFNVVGLDIKEERVEAINRKENPIEGDEPGLDELIEKVVGQSMLTATTDYAQLMDRDIVLIDVETPVDEHNIPKYHALKSACTSLAKVMKKGTLVIVESTIAPGTIRDIVLPILKQEYKGEINKDYFVGACPERVMPGRLLNNLRHMSRVCGGSTPVTAEVMKELYATFVEADLDLSDPITAEIVKTTENSYRDVQIAFANEVALICEANGADVWKVRDLVNKSPQRNMHLPGAGVGGHCIPKDPWLLAYSVHNLGVGLKIIPAARSVNDSMPQHIANVSEELLSRAKMGISDSKVLIMGYSYLENSDDTRNSPSETLSRTLELKGADVSIHDPWVEDYKGDVYEKAQGCDLVIFMVRHKEYYNLDLNRLKQVMRTANLVDGRNVFDVSRLQGLGFNYYSLGRG
ncbi:MAG TPA: nucleotide sugar dehydrogenase [Bellilinea sp.]|nr:nucleotide sugar dehydrogenase [Bellilinea sp.]